MRSKLLFGIGLGLLIGGILAANRATPASESWVLKRARQLGMVYPSQTRLQTSSPPAEPAPPVASQPAPQPPPKSAPRPALKPTPQPAPKAVSVPAPVPAPPPKPAVPLKPAPSPKITPQSRPEARPESAARQVTISEEATFKEIVKALEQAGVVTTADDRDLIRLEVRSGRRFIPGTFSIPPGQPLEEVIKRITSATR